VRLNAYLTTTAALVGLGLLLFESVRLGIVVMLATTIVSSLLRAVDSPEQRTMLVVGALILGLAIPLVLLRGDWQL
jgi:hypothetical protein